MSIVLTNVSGIIKELLIEQNKSIFELAKYLKMKPIDLKNKLLLDINKPALNNFTISQLENIGDFFGCELIVEYRKNDTEKIYHAKTVKEDMEETQKYFEEYMKDVF